MPSIAIIVLNWNNAPDTIACLDSLTQVTNPPIEIIVVDNHSDDDSVSAIQSCHPALTLLKTESNLGYAGGNNFGLRYALSRGAEYACILNNDVTVSTDFLASLLPPLQAADVGVVTPAVVEAHAADCIWALGSAVQWRTGAVKRLHAGESAAQWRRHSPFPVEIASGAAMLIKGEVLDRVGLLDESFYLYYEETDWCLRVRQAGYQILAVPASVVQHKVSATLGETSPIIDYYMLRNHLRFIARHWHGLRRLGVLGRTVARDLLTIVTYTFKSHSKRRLASRNARCLALRDAALGRWGKMGPDVVSACHRSSSET